MIIGIITILLLLLYYLIARMTFSYFSTKWKPDPMLDPSPFIMAVFFPITLPVYILIRILNFSFLVRMFSEFGTRLANYESERQEQKRVRIIEKELKKECLMTKAEQRKLPRKDRVLMEAEDEVEQLLAHRK